MQPWEDESDRFHRELRESNKRFEARMEKSDKRMERSDKFFRVIMGIMVGAMIGSLIGVWVDTVQKHLAIPEITKRLEALEAGANAQAIGPIYQPEK